MMKLEKEKKQELERVLNRVGLHIFYMAVSHLYDVGYRHMTEESVKEAIEEIKQEDDKSAIMTNDFKIHLVETSFEISRLASPLELAQFISGK